MSVLEGQSKKLLRLLRILTGQNAQNTPQNYNKVYETLVTNEDDIVGFVAYSLYKKSKQEYITAFEKENNRKPTSEEILTHVLCSEMPSLKLYRARAEQIVTALLRQAADEKQKELEKVFQRKLWEYVKGYNPPSLLDKFFTFFKSSWSGVAGNFITTFIVILFLYSVSTQASKDSLEFGAKQNIVSGIAKLLGVKIEIQSSE